LVEEESIPMAKKLEEAKGKTATFLSVTMHPQYIQLLVHLS
jgi:hypothetical protein